jgi:glucose/arabinose dehydrogenase
LSCHDFGLSYLDGVIRLLAITAVALAFLGAGSAEAASLQPIGSFDQPIYVTSDPGRPERILVVERAGVIKLVQGAAITTFSDLRSVVSCCEGERGLLSIALAPDFDASGRVFVDYTGTEAPGEIHVAELHAAGATASPSTLRNLLTIPHPEESNHNGGQLQFGPEGDLYISTGDGGGANDQHHNAQDLGSLLGKILRIDPRPSALLPYTVPAGNPFAAATSPADTIWSYGLRNPFRFSFDRLGAGMVIGDVGQDEREEIDYAPAPLLGAGANYGWNCREGTLPGPLASPDPQCAGTEPSDFVEPVFDYPHGPGCAIIGGYVVHDPSLGDLDGRYLFGDLCSGQIRSIDLGNPGAGDRSEGLVVPDLNSFGEDACGRIYAVSGDGEVLRLVGAAPSVCPKVATRVGIQALRSRVKHGGRAQIAVFVAPCWGRQGEPVKLLRGGRPIATRRLSLACTARFLARVPHRTSFEATIAEDVSYLPAASRRLAIGIDHHRSQARKRR